MKKLFIIAIAALFAGFLSAPANAADFSFNGYYHIAAQMGDNVPDFNDDDNLENFAWVWQTFIPTFTATVSEDLKGVLAFRFTEQGWGAPGALDGYFFGAYVDISGARARGFYDRAYIDFRIPNTPVRAQVGLLGPQTSKQLIIGGDNAIPGVHLTATLEKGNLGFWWMKIRENDATLASAGAFNDALDDDDIDLYIVEGNYTGAANTTVGAYLYFLSAGDVSSTELDGVEALWLGLTASHTAGALSLTGDMIFLTGEADLSAAAGDEGDISGWVTDLRAEYNAGIATLGGRLVYATGDDNLADTDFEAYKGFRVWYPYLTLWGGGRNNWLNNAQYAPWGDLWGGPTQNLAPGAGAAGPNGVLMISPFVRFAPTAKWTVEPVVAFIWSAEDNTLTTPVTTESYIGTELDLFTTYKVYDNLTWWTESGVMSAGDYLQYIDNDADDADNAWKVSTGLALAF